MATPTILINSATGSDTQASGAGPSTALKGTNASNDVAADGVVWTLDGSPDLSGVATDGSHALFLAGPTAGQPKVIKIIAVDNSAKTVQITPSTEVGGFGITWAIGGIRASIGGTTSKCLLDNNGAAGDATGGWIIEFQSGHAETIVATVTVQRTTGIGGTAPLIIRGTSGAATIPILTFSNTGTAFALAVASVGVVFRDFEVKNSSGNTSSSIAFGGASTTATFKIQGVKVRDATNFFWKAISFSSTTTAYIENCDIGNTNNIGIDFSLATGNFVQLRHNSIHNCGSHGVNAACVDAYDNDIRSNGGDGIHIIRTGAATTFNSTCRITQNTITLNTGDAIEVTGTSAQTSSFTGMVIENNFLSGNTGYALNFSGASVTAALLDSYYVTIEGNTLTGNSGASNSGKYNIDLSTILVTSANRSAGVTSGGGSRTLGLGL